MRSIDSHRWRPANGTGDGEWEGGFASAGRSPLRKDNTIAYAKPMMIGGQIKYGYWRTKCTRGSARVKKHRILCSRPHMQCVHTIRIIRSVSNRAHGKCVSVCVGLCSVTRSTCQGAMSHRMLAPLARAATYIYIKRSDRIVRVSYSKKCSRCALLCMCVCVCM